MASVRITNNIRYHVETRIKEMYAKRINDIELAITQVPGIGNELYCRHIPADVRAAAATLEAKQPGKWMPRPTELSVTIRYKSESMADGEYINYSFTIDWRPPSPAPINWGNRYHNPLQILRDYVCYQPIIDLITERANLIAERDSLISTLVRNVLEKCSTLRQVLEVWPQALEFMPDDVLTRHRAEETKRERLDLSTLEVDQSVKANLLKARIIASANQGK